MIGIDASEVMERTLFALFDAVETRVLFFFAKSCL